MEQEMKKISQILRPDYAGSVESSEDEENSNEAREAAIKIAVHILKGMKEQDLVDKLTKCKTATLLLLKSCRYKVNHSLFDV